MPGRVEKPAGSPETGEPVFLAVGKIRRPHGVTGDVLVEIYTDFPERLKTGGILYVGDKFLPLTIRRSRFHNDGILLAFDGLTTPEQVGKYRNHVLYVTKDTSPQLPEGEYYLDELFGLSVIDDTGKILGKLNEIIQTGANDVYVVKNDSGHEILLPAIKDVVLGIDTGKKQMIVHLIPGLLDDGDSSV